MRVLMSPAASNQDNPYLTLLWAETGKHCEALVSFSSKELLRGRPDVVHVHWPEFLLRWPHLPVAVFDTVKILGLLWLARRRGSALVWTAHNLEPHELPRPRLWRAYFRLFIAQVDLVISASHGATELLTNYYPKLADVAVAIVPHGHYRDVYPPACDAAQARRALRLDDGPVLVAFGQIRRYKNLPPLVGAWVGAPHRRGQLVVAGRPSSPQLAHDIRQITADAADVHLLFHFLDDVEVSTLFAAADVVVASYLPQSVLNSGVAILALSLGRPVVLTDTPAARELRTLVGADWVHLCDGVPDEAIQLALRVAAERRTGAPDLTALAWPELGRRTRQAYAEAVARRRSTRTGASPSTAAGLRSFPSGPAGACGIGAHSP